MPVTALALSSGSGAMPSAMSARPNAADAAPTLGINMLDDGRENPVERASGKRMGGRGQERERLVSIRELAWFGWSRKCTSA